jgi:hypothetical protein
MKAIVAAFAATLLLCLSASAAAQTPSRLKPTGEMLIAKMPAPSPTEEELAVPCDSDSEPDVESDEVLRLLRSRRAYRFAIDVWGVKWFPSHVANPPERWRSWMAGCTDRVFVLKQFKKAIGQPMTDKWTETDVRRLIEAVEEQAIKLVESGRLGRSLLEP